MTASAVPGAMGDPEAGRVGTRALLLRVGAFLDSLVVPTGAVLVSVVLFGAFVVTAAPVDEATLIAHCREHLASFKKPSAVRFVDDLPRNAAGKVLKRELRLEALREPSPDGTA